MRGDLLNELPVTNWRIERILDSQKLLPVLRIFCAHKLTHTHSGPRRLALPH